MSEKNENRWWENYLVRYLVPSIAGMFILIWLNNNSVKSEIVEVEVIKSEIVKSKIAEVEVIKPKIVKSEIEKTGILEQYFPMLKLTNGKDFNTASLTGWLLLGTLYCYIASYPILVFHAARVIFFDSRLTSKIKSCISCISCKSCISCILLIEFIIFFGPYYLNSNIFFLISLSLVIIFSISQCYFLYKVVEKERGYAYMKHLTKAKNVETLNIVEKPSIIVIPNIVETPNTVINSGYIKDITDSYKHLREHGNTALIILLEILLAFFLYFSLRFERENEFMDFSIVSIILIIWVFPAALVYFYGHLLERNFSEFGNEKNE